MTRINDIEKLHAQQLELRDRLLCCRKLNSGKNGRELAAEMLLYLDNPATCWELLTTWLLEKTRAQRIDIGFGSSCDVNYRPKFERLRDGCTMNSVIGLPMDARDSAISIVWNSQIAVKFSDVERDSRLSANTRSLLLSAGTRSKVAVALRDKTHEVGLLCCDTTVDGGTWTDSECWSIDTLAREIVGPIYACLSRLHFMNLEAASVSDPELDCARKTLLTPAENRVCELVMAGLSYKEIARQLARSPSTIDHQLRSVRRKLGVSSTAKLISELINT